MLGNGQLPPVLVTLLVGGAAAAGAALVEPGEVATDPLEPDIVVADVLELDPP